METMQLLAQAGNQNSILGDSFLNSKYFNPEYLFNKEFSFFNQSINLSTNSNVIALLHTFFFFLAIFFLTIIFYSFVRLFEIRKKERKHLEHEIEEYAHKQKEKEKKAQVGEDISENPRWRKVITYLLSESSSDWKLAVIEADSMLESLMDQMGFKGQNLGEKLKSADQGNFRGLSSAWEVHTIRNRIAHEGLSFELSQHEAKRVIALYEEIFRQYGYI